MVSPFRIDVPDAVLDDLRDRLARTRWPTQLDGAEWDYGTELSYLQELCTYWRDEFDWRAAEARLNAWPHFETEIDGEHLHFIHARSPHPDALPLVITHGWPGSVCEFLDILGPLTDPVEHGGDAADAFHVVCPSMPGYGWSGPTHQQGWDIRRVAEANATLMSVLGYDRYGAQGGDWGAIATTMIGLVDPEHVMGLHPKFRTWSDCDGDVESSFTKDQLLMNITTYWVTNTIASSVRLYCETQRARQFGPAPEYVDVPTGAAIFPKELYRAPRSWADAAYDIVHWTVMPRGGHFAAMEEPELLVDDIRAFFRLVR